MPENPSNNTAEYEAQVALDRVLACITERHNFILEAGAGAGKTYSLIQALQYIIEHQGSSLSRLNQQVACITYTNVAKDEIRARTDGHPVVLAETIHAFCWSLLNGFQSELRTAISELDRWPQKLEEAGEDVNGKVIKYDLGYPSIKDNVISISHDDVIALMVNFIEKPKFRGILTQRFPIILVDEYQDTAKNFVTALQSHFLDQNEGPLFGFFGDHWQKIYGTGCGTIESSNLEVIGKRANFRSDTTIVSALNRMRPELTQETKVAAREGSVSVYHTNNWQGVRRTESHWRGDMPSTDAHEHLQRLNTQLEGNGWDLQKTKILMLTHNVLAGEQGYRNLADVFSRNESFIKKEDNHVAFLVEIVEPACQAYENRQFGEMFSILGAKSLIRSHADKVKWVTDMDALLALRQSGTIGEVLDHLKQTKRPRLTDRVQRREGRLSLLEDDDADLTPEERRSLERIQKLRNVDFKEVTALTQFIEERTPFSTKHSVKGAEFDNVLVVVGRGWNQYDFGQMLVWMQNGVPPAKQDTYERNRNLFYVACSRPKHNLAILFTQELTDDAITYLKNTFGSNEVKVCP